VHVLLQGSVSDWVGRSSKILLLLAGLTVLIDLIGPDRFNRWADNASIRLDHAAKQLQDLRVGRPLRSLVTKMTRRVATGPVPPKKIRSLASLWFTDDEFDEFARRTRKKLKIENDWDSDFWGWEIANREAFRFLSSRLTQEEQRVLREANDLPRLTRRLTRWPQKIFLNFRIIVPVFWTLFYLLVFPFLGSSAGKRIELVIGVLGLALILLAFRIDWASAPTLIVIKITMAARFRLARGALALIGPKKDGWRLRLAALIAFIVGSLLDLVISW
jgi:hypothetical protein